MAATENSFGDSDILVMGDNIQAGAVHVATVEQQISNATEQMEDEIPSGQRGTSSSVMSARGVTDYNPIDLIVECTQYDESLQECLDRLDSEQANFEIGLTNAMLNAQYKMITEQTEMLTNAIANGDAGIWGALERIEEIFKVDVNTVYYESFLPTGDDGPFMKALKWQAKTLYNKVESFRSQTMDLLKVDLNSSSYNSWNASSDDGVWMKALKWQGNQQYTASGRINTNMNDFFKVGLGTSSYQSWDVDYSGDGMWARMLKWQGLQQLNATNRIRTDSNDLFKVGLGTAQYESWVPDYSDGVWAKMLKWQNKTLNSSINGYKTWIPDTLYSQDNNTKYAEGFLVSSSDSFFVKFWKTKLGVLNESIKGIKTGGGAATDPNEMFEVFEDSLDDFQSSLDKMVKYLKNFEFEGEAGTNLWDVLESMIEELGGGFGDLTDLLGDVMDFIDNMMDFFIEVFVPKENVIKDGFEDLQVVIGAKFQSMNALTNILESTFNKPQREFTKIQVPLPKYGTVTIMDGNWLNEALPVTRNLIGGAMMLFTTIWAYRKITTELIT